MEEFIETVFAWVGENESVLSGMVAIAVLIGLVATGVRRFALRSQIGPKTALELPVAAPKTELYESTLDQEIRYCRTSDRAAYRLCRVGRGYAHRSLARLVYASRGLNGVRLWEGASGSVCRAITS